MARTSTTVKEEKRAELIARHKEKRAALKKTIINPDISREEQFEAIFKLTKLPRDSSPSRYTTRCSRTGAGRAVYRKFGLNRISLRKLALEGMLPGVTKASW